MNDFLERMQQAWQSQCDRPLDVRPGPLLAMARAQCLLYFWIDVLMIVFFASVGMWMMNSAVRDIHMDWPWLIYVAGCEWVALFMLINRWLRRPRAGHFDESVLARTDEAIKDLEHRMRLDRWTVWWYILPITLGCMIPPVCFFAMDYGRRPLWDGLSPLLNTEFLFVVVFVFVYWVMSFGQRKALGGQLRELEALRALRDSLKQEEIGH